MKKIIVQIVGITIALAALPLSAMKASLLETCCKRSSFFASDGDDFKKEFDEHNRFSQEKISELLESMEDGGTVVVLGPGIGSDLPLDKLINKFDKTILIDGYTALLEAKIADLPDNLRKRVQVLNEDLTGGFFAILENERQNLKRAIAQDFLDPILRSTRSFINFNKFIKDKNLHLDLRQHSPSLVISSIVTSQILRLPDEYLSQMFNEMISDQDDSLLQAFAHEILQKIPPFFEPWFYSLGIAYWQCTLTPYFKAIASSSAKKIYHSLDILDKNSVVDDVILMTIIKEKEEYAKFDSFMASEYRLDGFQNNAWSYKGKLLVSWQIWHKKPVKCSRCGAGKNLKRCTGCYKIYYCGRDCQRADWGQHKTSCGK